MRSGLLRDLITMEPKVETTNVHGQVVTTWAGAFQVFAELQNLSEQQTATFNIRYRGDVTIGSHRIFCHGSIWTVDRVVHDQKNDQTTIESNFDSLIEVTHLQSTEREYIEGLHNARPPE